MKKKLIMFVQAFLFLCILSVVYYYIDFFGARTKQADWKYVVAFNAIIALLYPLTYDYFARFITMIVKKIFNAH